MDYYNLVNSDLKLQRKEMEMQYFMQKLLIPRKMPFFILWVGWRIPPCSIKQSSWKGGNKKRKKSATEDGIILGICLINHDENECP